MKYVYVGDINMSKEVLFFDKIDKNMIPLVGGKGANLGEMTKNKFPVPPGFVVSANAYEENMIENKILKEIESIEANINVDNTKELQNKSKEIKKIILKSKIASKIEKQISKAYSKIGSGYVAVRSSATAEDLPDASFAGQQNTYLNIKGKDKLIEAVKNCWASLFNARAIFYRRKQNFPIDKVKIAVVVQKMIDSEISGIMFSANPITNSKKEIVIEAGYGLGEAIVSGSITPDTYEVSKEGYQIIDKKISTQNWMYTKSAQGNKRENIPKTKRSIQKLDDDYIKELAKIGHNIEKHYNKPQDIEWALEGGVLYIVQSRPITTIKEINSDKTTIEDNIKPIFTGLGASSGIVSGKVKIVKSMDELDKVLEGDILVTQMTTPDMVPAMRRASGIITDEGGITSHAAIVSRELAIPAVVGTTKATKTLKDGQIVTIDSGKGKVYLGELHSKQTAKKIPEQEHKSIPFLTSTKVKVNVAMSEAAKRASETSAEGIGLLRAEHMITSTGKHPAYFIQAKKYDELEKLVQDEIRKVVKYFKDKPVFYRTFDARTDEFRGLKGGEAEPHETNPMLGWHGVRRSLDQPELIKAEFRAIKNLKEEGYNNIGIMIPFTQSVKEYIEVKKLARDAGLIPHKDALFGVMVETPGVVLTIDEYIDEGLDFISFGTNDLTQLTLGIDRNNERIQKWFTELHPAILKQIGYVISRCAPAGVITSICGQAASNPQMVKILVSMGIDSVSANIDAVDKIKETIYLAERELILEEIRKEKLKDISF